ERLGLLAVHLDVARLHQSPCHDSRHVCRGICVSGFRSCDPHPSRGRELGLIFSSGSGSRDGLLGKGRDVSTCVCFLDDESVRSRQSPPCLATYSSRFGRFFSCWGPLHARTLKSQRSVHIRGEWKTKLRGVRERGDSLYSLARPRSGNRYSQTSDSADL